MEINETKYADEVRDFMEEIQETEEFKAYYAALKDFYIWSDRKENYDMAVGELKYEIVKSVEVSDIPTDKEGKEIYDTVKWGWEQIYQDEYLIAEDNAEYEEEQKAKQRVKE